MIRDRSVWKKLGSQTSACWKFKIVHRSERLQTEVSDTLLSIDLVLKERQNLHNNTHNNATLLLRYLFVNS